MIFLLYLVKSFIFISRVLDINLLKLILKKMYYSNKMTSELSPQQLYGTTMFLIYSILPGPVKHEHFSRYMVHPIVYLLRPHIKKSIKICDNSYHYTKAQLVGWRHEYNEIQVGSHYGFESYLIYTDTCRLYPVKLLGLFWMRSLDCQFYCSSNQTWHHIYISDKTLSLYGHSDRFIGNTTLSEVYCCKNVCSKKLLGCKCARCDYHDPDYDVKYFGNYPFELKHLIDDIEDENLYTIKYGGDNKIYTALHINGINYDLDEARKHYIYNADINNYDNYNRNVQEDKNF